MKRKESTNSDMICVAEISGVHGIKGMVKLRIFIEDHDNIEEYMPLYDSTGKKEFNFYDIAPHKNDYLAYVEGVEDRNQAEKLARTKLYISRDLLPETEEDEFYYTDLINLTVKNTEDEEIGSIVNVVDFGAGELLEILHKEKNKTFYLQFKNEFVPKVDLENKFVTVNIPDGFI